MTVFGKADLSVNGVQLGTIEDVTLNIDPDVHLDLPFTFNGGLGPIEFAELFQDFSQGAECLHARLDQYFAAIRTEIYIYRLLRRTKTKKQRRKVGRYVRRLKSLIGEA